MKKQLALIFDQKLSNQNNDKIQKAEANTKIKTFRKEEIKIKEDFDHHNCKDTMSLQRSKYLFL